MKPSHNLATHIPDGIGRRSLEFKEGIHRPHNPKPFARRYEIIYDQGETPYDPGASFSGQDIKYMLMYDGINENTLLYDRHNDEVLYVGRESESELRLFTLDGTMRRLPR